MTEAPPQRETPPWSLAAVRPDVAAHLDANPDDFVCRECAADAVEEAGYPAHAERVRWMARAGRRPCFTPLRSVPHSWYWWEIDGYRGDPDALFSATTHPEWRGFFRRGPLRREPTRQAAEDALVEYLLRFDADPFAGDAR